MQQTIEEFVITAFKRFDTMKEQIKTRFEELEGKEPSSTELSALCWDIWRLTTFHLAAIRAEYGSEDETHGYAPYIPQEFVGERTERILAMDARLQEVLGDAVEDIDEDDADEDESFDFQPHAGEQIRMVEYGAIMVEHRWFVEQMNQVQLAPGDDGYVMNIIQLHSNGFDAVMGLLWDILNNRIRLAQ